MTLEQSQVIKRLARELQLNTGSLVALARSIDADGCCRSISHLSREAAAELIGELLKIREQESELREALQ